MSITHGIRIRIVRPLVNYAMKLIRRSVAGTNTRVVINYIFKKAGVENMKCKNCNGTGHFVVVLAGSKFDLSVIHCSTCGGMGCDKKYAVYKHTLSELLNEPDEEESLDVFR